MQWRTVDATGWCVHASNIFEPNNVKPVVDEAVSTALDYATGVRGTKNVYFMMGSDCELFV